MSKFLIDENPLIVLPSLACEIGITSAIVLQQIHFLCGQHRSGKLINGYKWIWNTYDEWKAEHFPFWSVRTIRNAVEDLRERKLIVTCKPNAKFNDHTLFYRVDRAAVESLITTICSDVAEIATSEDESDDKAEVADPEAAEVATSGEAAEVATSLLIDSETSSETSLGDDAADRASAPADEPPVDEPKKKTRKAAKTKTPADPRSSHPAIQLVRELISRYPDKLFYDRLIGCLGDQPNRELAERCWMIWRERAGSPMSFVPFTEWYVKGGPPPLYVPGQSSYRNGSTNGASTGKPAAAVPQLTPEQIKARRASWANEKEQSR